MKPNPFWALNHLTVPVDLLLLVSAIERRRKKEDERSKRIQKNEPLKKVLLDFVCACLVAFVYEIRVMVFSFLFFRRFGNGGGTEP